MNLDLSFSSEDILQKSLDELKKLGTEKVDVGTIMAAKDVSSLTYDILRDRLSATTSRLKAVYERIGEPAKFQIQPPSSFTIDNY